jgi:hypothetical protein
LLPVIERREIPVRHVLQQPNTESGGGITRVCSPTVLALESDYVADAPDADDRIFPTQPPRGRAASLATPMHESERIEESSPRVLRILIRHGFLPGRCMSPTKPTPAAVHFG